MFAAPLDRIDAALASHSRTISILAMAWFWAGCALAAGFVRLPDIPFVSDKVVFWAGVAVNAVWWGFVHPAIEKRRKGREAR